MKKWEAINIDGAEYIGAVSVEYTEGEWSELAIVKTASHLVAGGVCNTGLLQAASYVIDDYFSVDENTQGFIEDIEGYYRDGAGYHSDAFLCNARL